eukprot:scaffold53822_cov51-Phaeocystis_antarctica.AAC.2
MAPQTKARARFAEHGSPIQDPQNLDFRTTFERKLAPGSRIQDLRFSNENWRGGVREEES